MESVTAYVAAPAGGGLCTNFAGKGLMTASKPTLLYSVPRAVMQAQETIKVS